MYDPACATPPWDAIDKLYRDLRAHEQLQPGSGAARDLEAAIDLLLDGRITSSSPRYLARDAVRRATFLRLRGNEQRTAAAARLRPAHTITATPTPNSERRRSDHPQGDDTQAFEVAPVDIEDAVCADDLAERIVAAASTACRRPVAAVLDGLRRDLDTAVIATQLGTSRSTVLRTVTVLREQTRALMMNLVAA